MTDQEINQAIAEAKHHTAEVLAACDAAALSDTEESYALTECKRDSDFWSPAYESVRRRTRECIDLRKERDQLRAEVERLQSDSIRDAALYVAASNQADRWRKDAERLAVELAWLRSKYVGERILTLVDSALAAHDALKGETK